MKEVDVVAPAIFAIYFSGFSAHALEYNGVVYPTLEHAYHCLRFRDPKIVNEILAARSPEIAWELSQKYKPVRAALADDEKLVLMEILMRLKVEQHTDVRSALLKTGDARIEKRIVAGPPGDGFWDTGDGSGANHVGKIWMKLRAEIQDGVATG